MPELTDKQRAFVQEYLIDLNATQAAIRAGYSRKTARFIGTENLSKPYIAAAIEEGKAKRAERTRITQDKVLREIARLAFTDMRSFVKWGPNGFEFVDSDKLPTDETAAVTKVKLSPTRFGDRMELELGHKDSALRMLAEHVGLFDKGVGREGDEFDRFLAAINGEAG